MDKEDKNFKIITLIVIALVIFLVLLIVGTGVLWQNDNPDIPVIDSVERDNGDINKEVENDDALENRYLEYKDLYDKYSGSNITWYIKDCLNPEEDYIRGAYTKSVKIDETNELMIEDGKGYWYDSTYDIKEEFLNPAHTEQEHSPIKEKIEYLIVPFERDNLEYVWFITESNNIYQCTNQVSYSNYTYWMPFTFYNFSLIEQREQNVINKHRIVDMCYIEEKIPELSGIYFLTEEGELINEKGEQYVELTDEFYTLFNSAETATQDYITVKYLYFNSRSFIQVVIAENDYAEKAKEFWYIGCNEPIKEIYFSINNDKKYNPVLIKDIYFLTEDDSIYSYPLAYTYNEKVLRLYELLENVKEVEDIETDFIITTEDDVKHSGTALLYSDGV